MSTDSERNIHSPFGFISDLSVPSEDYSRNASCTLKLISTFLDEWFLPDLNVNEQLTDYNV